LIERRRYWRIVDDGLRAGAIIESIRASFRKDTGQRVLLDINDLIGDVLALAGGDLERHRIVVQVEMMQRSRR
jgi:hypothetical protein